MAWIGRTAKARANGHRSLWRDQRGIAAVELALILPVALLMLGLAVYGGEGLGIQRKVTLATRDVTDLVAQTVSTGAVNSVANANLNQSTLDYYLSLASLVVYPYDSSVLQVVVSEIQVTSGSTTGKVIWSEAYNGGTARTPGSTLTVSSTLTGSGAAYLLLGESQYTYTPVGLANLLGAMTISGQIYMIPRQTTQISIIWGS
jgi:Flp pilus assembly protein TadG